MNGPRDPERVLAIIKAREVDHLTFGQIARLGGHLGSAPNIFKLYERWHGIDWTSPPSFPLASKVTVRKRIFAALREGNPMTEPQIRKAIGANGTLSATISIMIYRGEIVSLGPDLERHTRAGRKPHRYILKSKLKGPLA